MRVIRVFTCLFLMMMSVAVSAGQGGEGGTGRAGGKGGDMSQDDQNGGAGLPSKNGKPGMNGCPGGTRPAPDGKFYLPKTHEECNPAHARKQTSHDLNSVIEVTVPQHYTPFSNRILA